MLLLAGLTALAALSLVKQKQAVDAVLAEKQGPELVTRVLTADDAKNTDEDALVYQNSFFRALPLILKASRSPITRDLLQRGRQVAGHVGGMKAKDNEKLVRDILRFLKDVDNIQGAAQRGDWVALKETLAGADRDMFTRCDADIFYEDAKEVVDFVTVALPKFFVSASEVGAASFKDTEKQIQDYFDNLKDNIFMSGDIVRRERDNAEMRWEALAAYVPARERFLASPENVGTDLRDAWADLVDAFDSDDAAFAPMLNHERERLVEAILKRADSAKAVSLIRLCELGEAVGVSNDRLAEWRKRAANARMEIARQYREMYSDYRMRAAVSPGAKETLAVLDEMLALGLDDNSFHKWALREKARVSEKKSDGNGKTGEAK